MLQTTDYELDQWEVEYMGRPCFAGGTLLLYYSEHDAEPDVGVGSYNELEKIEAYDDCFLVDVENEQEITIPKDEFAKLFSTSDNYLNEVIND